MRVETSLCYGSGDAHMQAFLTFDIGTSALKTALIADGGAILAVDVAEYTFATPRPGWIEMDPDTYWQAAISGTRKVLDISGISPASIAAIGFSSQGQTFVPVDVAGKPLCNALVWLDKRAADIAHEWKSTWLPQDAYRRLTGYPSVEPMLTVFKIAWLSRNLPDILKAWKFLCLPDYLILRMTGETATDYTMAQSTGLYDIVAGKWADDLVTAAGLSRHQLPEVLKPSAVAGKLSGDAARELGVCPGVPVCVGANDQLCGAVGAGNVRKGMVSETMGTALAIVATTDTLPHNPALMAGRHPVEEAFFAMTSASTTGIVLKWLRDLCCKDESYEDFLSDVADIPIGSEGLTVLPHFCGSGDRPDAGGAFVGLTLGHTRSHLARATMESCCCVLRELLDMVSRDKASSEVVRCLGGAARSDLWLQMKADMLGTRVERPMCTDAASLGAAMLAAVGSGACDSVRAASEAWYRPGKLFEPGASRTAAYQVVYERYLATCKRVYRTQ